MANRSHAPTGRDVLNGLPRATTVAAGTINTVCRACSRSRIRHSSETEGLGIQFKPKPVMVVWRVGAQAGFMLVPGLLLAPDDWNFVEPGRKAVISFQVG